MSRAFLLLLFFHSTLIYAIDRCEKSTIEKFGFNYVIFKEKPINVTSRRVWAVGNDFHLDTMAIQLHPIALKSSIVKGNILVPLLEAQGMRLNEWYAICGQRKISGGRLCEDCTVVRFCKCDCAEDKRYEIQLNISWVMERDQMDVETSLKVPKGFSCPLERRMVVTLTNGCSKQRDFHDEGRQLNGSFIVTTYPSSGGHYISSASVQLESLSANPCFLIQELSLVAGKIPSLNWGYSQMIKSQKVLLNQGDLRVKKEAIVGALVPFKDVEEDEILCQEIENFQKEMENSGVNGAFDFFWLTLVIWMCLKMVIVFL